VAGAVGIAVVVAVGAVGIAATVATAAIAGKAQPFLFSSSASCLGLSARMSRAQSPARLFSAESLCVRFHSFLGLKFTALRKMNWFSPAFACTIRPG